MSTKGSDTYKLKYFTARGAGELPRLIFAAAGKQFEDVRMEHTGEEWQKYKPETPMKSMPVLDINGEIFCQSGAIARYLARKFGLMGSSDQEDFLCDEAVECVNDTAQALYKPIFEKDEARKGEYTTAFKDVAMPKLTDYVAKRMEKYGKDGHMLGNKLTLADLVVFNFSDSLCLMDKESVLSPIMTTHYQKIKAIPTIAAWLASRPKTEY